VLPAPYRGPADANPPRDGRHIKPFGRKQHKPGASDVLLGTVPIGYDRLQASAIVGRDQGTDRLRLLHDWAFRQHVGAAFVAHIPPLVARGSRAKVSY
jgi:hypothetical protein